MHSLLVFTVLLSLLDFAFAIPSGDSFDRNADFGFEERNRKVRELAGGSLKSNTALTEDERAIDTPLEMRTEGETAPESCPHPVSSKLDYESGHLNSSLSKKIDVPESVQLHDMTVCEWIFNNDTKGLELEWYPQFGYTERIFPRVVIGSSGGKVIISVSQKRWALYDELVPMGKWHQICITWGAASNGSIGLYANGKQLVTFENRGASDYVGGFVFFSQKATTAYNPKQPTEGFLYKSSGVHLWDYVLTKEQVLQHYRCGSTFPGNVINWDKTEYAVEPGQ